MSKGSLKPPYETFSELAARAVAEDLGPDGLDATGALVGQGWETASLVARREGVLCGLEAVPSFLAATSTRLSRPTSGAATKEASFEALAADGDRVGAGTVLGLLSGPADILLAAERPMLNLIGRLSGISTITAEFEKRVSATKAVVRDTRKTTPGLRLVEKYAVRCGGGMNHRMGLYDAVLVKDNHVAACGSITDAVRQAAARFPQLPLEVEVDTLAELAEALDAGCDLVLLDNMSTREIAEAVSMAKGRAALEASGGISIDNVAEIAALGVDFVAVGALTHSAPALDVALDWGRRA